MYIVRRLRVIFLGIFVQIVFGPMYLTFSQFNTGQAALRYFEDRFEINIPALPTGYEYISSNLKDVDIKLEGTKLVISNLVPDQVYNGVEIIFYDNLGRKYEIVLNNIITSQPTKPDNKFVYDVYTNGLGRKPDHSGFKYWYESLESFNVTAVEFVKEMVNSDEFALTYTNDSDRINALYKTILGRYPDQDGFDYWKSKFLNLVNGLGFSHRQAISELVDEMVESNEFIDIVGDSGFLYMM